MATPSLYRRYRPRRFSEVKGQDHVVMALRNAVAHHREGQAYLFSGPRGTGKTSSARILAKVLNCANPVDGEPCCECDSCVAVERGTSYDVFELDAASNNGVDAIRDLVERASLGSPGRHKVYILDEVHMLSKQAEAALLKTLEEPPDHVVFVLATTDPQKVSDTIRSRTQHLQFHLLPMDVMESHIRWLAADAGIEVDEAAVHAVLRQGAGSARDTVSALELVAASDGAVLEAVPIDELVEAFIDHDPGRALAIVARATQQGRDPRTLTDDVVRHLRDCFLSLVAPELVQLPATRLDEVRALAGRLGTAAIVRAMERLGEMLVEMRHAPDPRLLLEVALVQLTHQPSDPDVSVILGRLERLERQLSSAADRVDRVPAPSSLDPATGRAALGAKARREPSAAPAPAPRSTAATTAPTSTVTPTPATPPTSASATAPAPAPAPAVNVTAAPASASTEHPSATGPSTPDAATAAVERWASDVLPGLNGLARAMFAATKVVGVDDGALVVAAPNDTHRQRCLPHVATVEAVVAAVAGAPVTVRLVVDGAIAHDDNVVSITRQAGAQQRAAEEHEIDPDELVDVPPDAVVTPVERLLQAFPGSVELDEA